MSAIASQITNLAILYPTVYSDADQRKHQSSASLAFVWGIYRWPVNSPHKWPVSRKMFPFDDVIMPEPKDNCNLVIHRPFYQHSYSCITISRTEHIRFCSIKAYYRTVLLPCLAKSNQGLAWQNWFDGAITVNAFLFHNINEQFYLTITDLKDILNSLRLSWCLFLLKLISVEYHKPSFDYKAALV